MNTPLDPTALWAALQEREIDDDLEEIEAMSDEELDHYIASNGGDPNAIRASGPALIKELLERNERLGWHAEMEKKLEDFRAMAAASRTTVILPRAELERRLTVARNDPRFSAPVAALFRKKTPEASTDEELQALLDQIALLAKLEEE